jgi:hypothetical protein
MLPRLEAEETLAAVTATALGTGALKPADAWRVEQALQRQAGGVGRPATFDPRVPPMIGIGVEIAPSPLLAQGNGGEGRGGGHG